ncbi:MAG: hypothetical protein H6672_03065 [Anaerolineaceae bacterium]|nr:hypothetical protein [Anaerolineaceae bacterium]
MIPELESHLPHLMYFIRTLAENAQADKITAWPQFIEHVRSFYTPSEMKIIEQVVPGWLKMASYANQTTLIHVTSVLAALLLCPEYQVASPDQQRLMEWIVLYHDVAKEVQPGQRDQIHGFRSAALTGKALPTVGFPVTAACSETISPWFILTDSAVTPAACQDNSKLPAILAGIDRLFGEDTPAALVIKGVLLHMSINALNEWPQAAPLSDDEIHRYVSPSLLPLLKVMMLVDNDAWAFFDSKTKEQHQQETRAVFARVEQMIDAK